MHERKFQKVGILPKECNLKMPEPVGMKPYNYHKNTIGTVNIVAAIFILLKQFRQLTLIFMQVHNRF